MIRVSLISKLKYLVKLLRCELKEGHEWVVLFAADNNRGSYDVLLECRKCGKRIWKMAFERPDKGTVLKEVNNVKS